MGLELPPQEGGWPPCHAGFLEGQDRPAAQGDANEMLRLHECTVRHTDAAFRVSNWQKSTRRATRRAHLPKPRTRSSFDPQLPLLATCSTARDRAPAPCLAVRSPASPTLPVPTPDPEVLGRGLRVGGTDGARAAFRGWAPHRHAPLHLPEPRTRHTGGLTGEEGTRRGGPCGSPCPCGLCHHPARLCRLCTQPACCSWNEAVARAGVQMHAGMDGGVSQSERCSPQGQVPQARD